MKSAIVTKTLQQILEFQRLAAMRMEKERLTKTFSKLNANLCHMLGEVHAVTAMDGILDGNLTAIIKNHHRTVKLLQREFCSKDEINNLMFDENGMGHYTPGNQAELEAAIEQLKQKLHTFSACYCKKEDLPLDLMNDEKKAYLGFVIEPNPETDGK